MKQPNWPEWALEDLAKRATYEHLEVARPTLRMLWQALWLWHRADTETAAGERNADEGLAGVIAALEELERLGIAP